MDYRTFGCRFGASKDVAEEIYTSEINKRIDAAVEQGLAEFYLEIISRSENHKPKSVETTAADCDAEDDDGFYEDED